MTQARTEDPILALEQLLVEEQQAVARIDTARLGELGAEKERLMTALRSRPAAEATPAARARLPRVAALARANATLLAAASEAMAEALGVHRPLGTYDARARMRGATGSLAVRIL